MQFRHLFYTLIFLLLGILYAAFPAFASQKENGRREIRALYIGNAKTAAPAADSGENLNRLASANAAVLLEGNGTLSVKENSDLSAKDRLRPPKIDGRLDDPVWQLAQPADGFTQRDPREGEPATEPTEVRVLYDEHYLYIGFRCFDSEPDKIVAREMRNDADLGNDDNVRVILDTYLDRRNGFAFQTNPLGTRWDAQITDEGRNINKDWNCVWEVNARRHEKGWDAELRIPLNQLRFPDRPDMSTWGINFARVIRRKREDTYWSPILRDYGFGDRAFYRISRAGNLTGLDFLRRRPRLEIRPYSLSGLKRNFTATPTVKESIFDMGLDVKYGLSADLIADITINTDFAQVEADQERVNLTRFSLFFPEKRDFFLEGAGIFRIGAGDRPGRGGPNEQLFYSRRIGLHGGDEVPILAGAKVTGNLGGLEVGFIDVVTDRYEGEEERLPRTNYGVIRLRRPVLERSSVGVMILSRDPMSGGEYNRTFAVDGNFAFGPSTNISGWLAKTQTPGIDKKDWAGDFSFNYRSDKYTLRAGYTEIQDQFNAEMGFIRRTDIRRFRGEIGRGLRPGWSWLRRTYNGIALEYLTDGDNVLQTRELSWRTWTQFESGHTLFLGPKYVYEFIEQDWEIHDGIVIPAGVYRFMTLDMFFRSDAGRKISARLGGNLGEFYSGTRWGGNLSLNYRPSSHFAWDLSFNTNLVRLPAGDFTTNVLSTRLTYTLSRDMFAKAFVQWNDDADLLSLNFLYNFYYRPGSNIYLVYNQRWDLSGGSTQTMDRAVLLKVNYWLSL